MLATITKLVAATLTGLAIGTVAGVVAVGLMLAGGVNVETANVLSCLVGAAACLCGAAESMTASECE